MKTILAWFRQDLRLQDNPAFYEASKSKASVIPVYILEDRNSSSWSLGGASKWWLHRSLKDLDECLRELHSKLILRNGNAQDELNRLIKETGADTVYWNRLYEPENIKRDKKIKEALKKKGIRVESFNASLLFEPWEIKTKQGGPYKVYTPFWNACLQMEGPRKPLPKVKTVKSPAKWPKGLKLSDLKLNPEIPWDAGLSRMWTPGREAALSKLRAFKEEPIFSYQKNRDVPSVSGTSQLSPYLHFGEISPHEIWHQIKKGTRTTPYLRQLIWREFAYHLLYHFPKTPSEALYEKFKKFPWRKNKKMLRAWQKGQTGYPIVDAGMRELWATGWMHNRVRMIVGSFLVKDLLIPWQNGAEWFWDTLVDADLANNTLGWQWIAGCGADAAPYFRIFNPIRQSEKFDPMGAYIRKWIPEISKLSDKTIHAPWEAEAEALKEAGIKVGETYPKPIVDHNLARREALQAYEKIKN